VQKTGFEENRAQKHTHTHLANVEAGQVREKVVSNKKAHQHPIIQNILKVVFEGQLGLKRAYCAMK